MIVVGSQLQEVKNMPLNFETNPFHKVLVIGLGQIGYSNAKYMTSKGLWVDGYDISQKAVNKNLTEAQQLRAFRRQVEAGEKAVTGEIQKAALC